MKFITVGLSFFIGMALTSQGHTLGEHTINRQDTADFSIERSLPSRFDDEQVTMAACIALPDAWEMPLAATIAPFDVTAARFEEGETQISQLQALEEYTWYCYQDSLRDFAANDTASITFSLTTEDANTKVYTSIGFIEGVSSGPRSLGDYYYQSISSHQVIRDTQAADYYANLSSVINASMEDDFDPSSESFTIVNLEDSAYFLGYNGLSFSIDSDGVIKSYQTPINARAFYVNEHFIFLISQGIPDVLDTQIQFGRDLNNLSPTYDIKEVGYAQSLTYDNSNNHYVMLNPGTSSAATKAYYTSPDLKAWTENTVGLWQNYQVVFSDDGRAVMKNLSLVDSLMYRAANGEWQAFSHYPSDQYFSTRDILFAHNRFHILLKEYSKENSGEVLSLRIGYSDDLTDWNWTTLTTDSDEIASVQSLVDLGSHQVGIINDESFFISSDQGKTWSNAKSPIAALQLDNDLITSEPEMRIESLVSINETIVGSARVLSENNELSDIIFTTINGSEFEQIHRTKDPLIFSLNDDIYFYESNRAEWAINKAEKASLTPEKDPDTEADMDSNEETSIGSLFWFLSILITLGFSRNRKTNNKTL